MAQESVAQSTPNGSLAEEPHSKSHLLGPILCWAVVFADIGTSIYYVPGILYHSVQGLAAFFVFLTMSVFILLAIKYAEVTHRFPQGGGVVTVAAQALNPWFGALGGMFILVDYFLTAAISGMSGIVYLSVVLPQAGHPIALWITIGVLILLGILNWIGISESAKVSLVGALIAFFSNIAVLITVFTHISFSEFLSLFPRMFANNQLTTTALLVGFAGSFLAFSGLESISQLSPVMKHPHKKVAGLALFFVVLTIALTSPLLTLFTTTLLPDIMSDEIRREQSISLLAGNWGNTLLQAEVAISASALLVFACNTAIIGAYHVFMALARMEFLPAFFLKRNKLRGTPHYAILFATVAPIVILVVVNGNITFLGDMYAFGLLGAFTLTCLGLDIVRARDWRRSNAALRRANISAKDLFRPREDDQSAATPATNTLPNGITPTLAATIKETSGLWFKIIFFLGILTTVLVALAWSINLVTKHLATYFGGGITLLGLAVAYINYVRSQKSGRIPVPVVVTRIEERLPDSVLAVLLEGGKHNDAVIQAAVNHAEGRPLVFLYVGEPKARETAPRMMEIVDPYLEDPQAKENFGKAESRALKAKVPIRKYVYLRKPPEVVNHVWQMLHPRDTVVASEQAEQFKDINPDRIRYEITPAGKVAHLLKRWEPAPTTSSS